MDLKKRYGTDKEKEVDGTWIDLGEGLSVLVARYGNPRFEKLRAKLLRPHRAAMARDNLPEETSRKIGLECFARAILLGWKGLEDEGKPVEYSPQKALEMLTKYPDFRDVIADLSTDMDRFRLESEEAAKGN